MSPGAKRLPARSTEGRLIGRARLPGLGVLLMLVGVTLGIPASNADFTATTSSDANRLAAAVLAPPTGLTTSEICTSGITNGPTPVYESKTTTSGSANSVTLNKPTGTTAGDLLITHVGLPSSTVRLTLDLPAGWAFLRRDRSNLPAYAVGSDLVYRIAGAGEPASYTFDLSSSSAYAGLMLRISGVDTRSPFDAHAGLTGPSSTNVTAPAVRSVADNVLLLEMAVIATSTTFASPGGMTEINDLDEGSLTIQAATQGIPTAGAVGTRTATAGSADVYAAALVAIRPLALDAAPLQARFASYDNGGTGGGSVSHAGLSGLTTGDLLVLAAGWHGPAGAAPTLPAGWTQVRVDANGTTESIGWWYRVVTGGEIWPLTLSPGSARAMTTTIFRVTNTDTTDPIAGSGANTGIGTALTAPAVTVTRKHTLALHYLVNDDPAGRIQYSPGPSVNGFATAGHTNGDMSAGFDHAIATTTTAAASTWNADNSRPWLATTLAINPAPNPYNITTNLSWTPSATTWAAGYTWQRWSGTLQQTGTVTGRATSTTIDADNLTDGTVYTYRLNSYAGSWTSTQITTSHTPTCP